MFDSNRIVEPRGGQAFRRHNGYNFRRYQFDTFSNQLVLRPNAIATVQKAQKMDDAEEKRVELHLHTAFSEMDAIAKPRI
jgi:DNA polymerase III alpha subunit (gram-positive type)